MAELAYEEIQTEEEIVDSSFPLINYVGDYECEEIDCEEQATCEFKAAEEDGDTYYTYRCDAHPVKSLNYEMVLV